MTLRGKIIKLSRYEGCRPRDYICTADCAGHVEIVPTEPGREDTLYPPIPLSGPMLPGTLYDSWNDPKLIEDVKARCRQRIHDMVGGFDRDAEAIDSYRRIHANLTRLQSLDGDQPAAIKSPVPNMDYRAAKNRLFEELYGGKVDVVAVIQDSLIPVNQEQSMIGANPSHVGKLVFVEIPLECDENGESGEYIIVEQSPDSLYGIKTTCCQAGLEVVRIPFESGEHKIAILNVYEDDAFVQEFIERLDDMDTDDYPAIECDLAETASRQLARMLEQKFLARARKETNESLDRLFRATDSLFNTLGVMTGRMANPEPPRAVCGQRECCGCGSN